MPNTQISRELIFYQRLRNSLEQDFPDIDDQTLQDTLEGLTSLHDQLAEVVRSALEDESLLAALRQRISDMRDRAQRLENRAKAKRQIVADTMTEAAIRKLLCEDLTITSRPSPPALQITDELEVPEPYWKPQPPKLDRQAIITALKKGDSVPGVTLSNGQPTLSVRTK